jgi:hypothetical protein
MKSFLSCQLLFRLAEGGRGWGMTRFHIDAIMNSYCNITALTSLGISPQIWSILGTYPVQGPKSLAKIDCKMGLQCKVSSSIPSGQIKYSETVRLQKEE